MTFTLPLTHSQEFALSLLEESHGTAAYVEPIFEGSIAVQLGDDTVVQIDKTGVVRDSDGDVIDVGEF